MSFYVAISEANIIMAINERIMRYYDELNKPAKLYPSTHIQWSAHGS